MLTGLPVPAAEDFMAPETAASASVDDTRRTPSAERAYTAGAVVEIGRSRIADEATGADATVAIGVRAVEAAAVAEEAEPASERAAPAAPVANPEDDTVRVRAAEAVAGAVAPHAVHARIAPAVTDAVDGAVRVHAGVPAAIAEVAAEAEAVDTARARAVETGAGISEPAGGAHMGGMVEARVEGAANRYQTEELILFSRQTTLI